MYMLQRDENSGIHYTLKFLQLQRLQNTELELAIFPLAELDNTEERPVDGPQPRDCVRDLRELRRADVPSISTSNSAPGRRDLREPQRADILRTPGTRPPRTSVTLEHFVWTKGSTGICKSSACSEAPAAAPLPSVPCVNESCGYMEAWLRKDEKEWCDICDEELISSASADEYNWSVRPAPRDLFFCESCGWRFCVSCQKAVT